MGRGLWHVAAVGGERLHAHARNRTQSASQSASRRCQAPCPRAVTKLDGQNDGQERPNLVYELDRAVLRLGEAMDHTQADQTRLYQAGKFLVRNLVAKFGHLLEGH